MSPDSSGFLLTRGEHADWSSLGSLGLSLGLARGQKLLGTLRTEHWSRFSGADDPTWHGRALVADARVYFNCTRMHILGFSMILSVSLLITRGVESTSWKCEAETETEFSVPEAGKDWRKGRQERTREKREDKMTQRKNSLAVQFAASFEARLRQIVSEREQEEREDIPKVKRRRANIDIDTDTLEVSDWSLVKNIGEEDRRRSWSKMEKNGKKWKRHWWPRDATDRSQSKVGLHGEHGSLTYSMWNAFWNRKK